jgi:hypothetical protein
VAVSFERLAYRFERSTANYSYSSLRSVFASSVKPGEPLRLYIHPIDTTRHPGLRAGIHAALVQEASRWWARWLAISAAV